jgi:hypothetical protein
VDDCGMLCRRSVLGGYVCGVYFDGAAMSEITIDDLSHENSLIRARNERLEAEKVEFLTTLREIAGWTERWCSEGHPISNIARRIIEKHTGSAT